MVIRHEYGELYYQRINGKTYIESIYVHPKHREKGVGTWLMRTCLSRCNCPVYLFATNELGGDIKRLKRFYRRFGFRAAKPDRDAFPYNYNMVLWNGWEDFKK